jgi:hypothetical protein
MCAIGLNLVEILTSQQAEKFVKSIRSCCNLPSGRNVKQCLELCINLYFVNLYLMKEICFLLSETVDISGVTVLSGKW